MWTRLERAQPGPTDIVSAAASLAALLRQAPSAALSPAETALLLNWLTRLSDTTDSPTP
ncbi:hypothetical protein SAMN05216174_101123 [Actinokineospora iranica]|uniref:Uncharacterized protein n=1 Tax=Actinokineospora iranica TaxID=1271860 RepID=A0A1G6IVL9_9PSEU|nr:hypothetical protein SAMN05216174_101123 [Actinokineospora iranica]